MKFDQRIENLPHNIWQVISQIDEYKGQWSAGINLHPQALGRLKQSVLITSTGASTRIEGAKLSNAEIEKMMRGLSVQTFSNRDEQEVKSYYELLKNVFNAYEVISFNEGTIKHFHQEVLKHVNKDQEHRGKYKIEENKVVMFDKSSKLIRVLFDTTPPYLVAKEMQELIDWTKNSFEQKKYHSLVVIANFVIEFLNIHPFSDGNGRVSRILTNFLMLKMNYLFIPYVSHEKLIEDNKINYYLSLRKSQQTFKGKRPDIQPWLQFFLKIVLEQAKIAISLISKENIEAILSDKQLKVWQYMQQIADASPMEISQKTKIIRSTVSQTINKLLKLKKIERFGEGSATRYRLVK